MDTVSAGSSAGSSAASAGQGTVPGQPHGRALRLRPLRADDEAAFAAAHAVMTGERFRFGIGYEPGMPWDSYLARLADQRHGRNLSSCRWFAVSGYTIVLKPNTKGLM